VKPFRSVLPLEGTACCFDDLAGGEVADPGDLGNSSHSTRVSARASAHTLIDWMDLPIDRLSTGQFRNEALSTASVPTWHDEGAQSHTSYVTVSTHQEIDRLLRSAGVLRRSDHPELARTLDYLVRAGRLRAVLPG
jgi:hypothetical protein